MRTEAPGRLLWAGALAVAATLAGMTIPNAPVRLQLAVLACGYVALLVALGLARYLLLAAIVLSPIAVGPLANDGTAGGSGASSLRLVVVLVASAAVLLRSRSEAFSRPALVSFGGLVIWLMAGLPFSPSPPDGARYVAKLLLPVVLTSALVALEWRGVRIAETLGIWLLVGTLSVDGALLVTGQGYYSFEGHRRFGGLSGSGPGSAFVISLLAILVLLVWVRTGRRLAFWSWAGALPILAATLTRSGLAVWFVGSALVLALSGRKRPALVLLAPAVALVVLNASVAGRFLHSHGGSWGSLLAALAHGRTSAIDTTGRSQLWAEMVRRFHEAPLTGHGAGSADVYTAQFTSGVLRQPHSEYLSLLVSGGVVALALWLAFLVDVLRAAWRCFRPSVGIPVAYALLAAVDNPVENYAQAGIPFAIALAWTFSQRTDVGVRER